MQIPPRNKQKLILNKISSSAIFLQPSPIKIAIKPKISCLHWELCRGGTYHTAAQLTLEDVRFGCEVESNGQRDHQDSEEQQCFQGWDQGAFVPAKDPCKSSWICQSKTASSLFGSNGTDSACGAFSWQPLLWFGIKAAEGKFVFTQTRV